ncbi:MAG TPA: hypothetical protein PLQ00_13685, partial [Thermoguttaceae bacterium]|nr:hypothetical protein [Thermoguttaceae bacterium]
AVRTTVKLAITGFQRGHNTLTENNPRAKQREFWENFKRLSEKTFCPIEESPSSHGQPTPIFFPGHPLLDKPAVPPGRL